MNIVAIGDLHGRDNWQKIVEKENPDRFVFIGDYFDSRDGIHPDDQLKNFERVLRLKKQNPEQVVLLIGNHDYHYLNYTGQFYSSYQASEAARISALLKPAVDEGLMKMCYTYENMVFTHAGITRSWAEANHIDLDNLQESVNTLFKKQPTAFEFTPGKIHDATGDEVCQTPIWVRPHSLQKDGIKDCIQIVGHTIQYEINRLNDVYLIDTLGTSGQYLCWNPDGFSIRSVKAATNKL